MRIAVNSLPQASWSLRSRCLPGVRAISEHMFVPSVSIRTRSEAKALIDRGLSDYEVSRRTGVSRSTVQRWRVHGLPRGRSPTAKVWRPMNRASYAYLLGIYLGNGYLSKAAESPVLEIALDARYPCIAAECVAAIWDVAHIKARSRVRQHAAGASIRVSASGRIWLSAFPQHGPGKKHTRAIELGDWQKAIVGDFPELFLRGRPTERRSARFLRWTEGLTYAGGGTRTPKLLRAPAPKAGVFPEFHHARAWPDCRSGEHEPALNARPMPLRRS